jgi:hypothetical protein
MPIGAAVVERQSNENTKFTPTKRFTSSTWLIWTVDATPFPFVLPIPRWKWAHGADVVTGRLKHAAIVVKLTKSGVKAPLSLVQIQSAKVPALRK